MRWPPSKMGKVTEIGPIDQVVPFVLIPPDRNAAKPTEPLSPRRGYLAAWALPTSPLAAATSSCAANTSGRCASSCAGNFGITTLFIAVEVGNTLGTFNFCLISGSDSVVNATRAFTCISHWLRCSVNRAWLCALLARARAALAGAVKPVFASKSVKREVSAREVTSSLATPTNCSQLRRFKYVLATSAATDTRASCQPAWLPARRAKAASLAARLPPHRSTSQLACRPTWPTLATGTFSWLPPRLALAAADRFGATAAPAATTALRACWMRLVAAVTDGLTAWALLISSTSSGSPKLCHQLLNSFTEP